MRLARRAAWLLALLPAFAAASARAADGPFYLKDGDRVVFYGDSITDQRLYTTFVETYVVTRFPKTDVTFVHSGWGGDRVTGGGGGPIDVRLDRDVFPYRPTVVTVMLGMNDAGVRPFDPKTFETFVKGYEHIVESAKSHLPGVRMTLIRPSPFDDVTREPLFKDGYNSVLVRYGDFVQELAKKNGLDVADLNSSVVEATKKAFALDPANAKNLNFDRVHPGPGGQLLMAAALLKAWNVPGLVSRVEVKVDKDSVGVDGKRTKVSDAKLVDGLPSWTQLDDALPFPIDRKDPTVELAVKSSSVVHDLDRQPLKVSGLSEGEYVLKVDDAPVGTFTAEQLEKGVNLATLPTPMAAQAAAVHQLTLRHNNVHYLRWRQVQVPLNGDDPALVDKALKALDEVEASVVKKQRETAQPKPHAFALSRKAN